MELDNVKLLMTKYEHLDKDMRPDNIKITKIIDLCVNDLQELLAIVKKEMPYKMSDTRSSDM